ncbi:MAG: GntR family transcriptional regulator, partial [bacterium]|nr:GntR family transcriptional regulator [bacterium]
MNKALGPIEKQSIKDRIYGELRQALMLGYFEPGKPITIPELAETFGTSHMPVREALRRLVSEQALVILSNRSVAVPDLTLERYEDLLRTRMVIEGTAASWAAGSINDQELTQLRTLNQEIGEMQDHAEPRLFLAKHQELHFTVYQAARSPISIPIIEILWLQIGPYHNLMFDSNRFRLDTGHHEALIDALAQRDEN